MSRSSETLLENLVHPGVSMAEPQGAERERMVQIFVRHLLLALRELHSLRIAHLDLRPETILMQDGRLKLADFGQARRLLRGIITGSITGSPEFVSPEIVRGYPLTLLTDMWSVGTLTYILLTGVSPFHGDNDEETLKNVNRAEARFDNPAWQEFSEDARNFVKGLLQEVPACRPNCDEALRHFWLSGKELRDAELPADGLREFCYKHKWLERRVFVQQTPSEQILEAVLGPSTVVAQPKPAPPVDSARPVEIYDYLRIKPRPPAPVEDVPRRRRERPPYIDEYGQPIEDQLFDPQQYPRDIPRLVDPFGGQRQRGPAPPSDRSRGQPPPGTESRRIPLDQHGRLVRPEDLARIPHDKYGRPIGLEDPNPAPERRREPPEARPPPPDYQMTEKRKLLPQEKGETPTKSRRQQPEANGHAAPKEKADKEDFEDPGPGVEVPLRMIRGERRQIEEEIANRILSDISEEGSLAGSIASLEDFDLGAGGDQAQSRSTTPHAESEASSTMTLSPATVRDAFYDHLPRHEKELLENVENDPSIPVGAPLFLEGLHNTSLVVDTATVTAKKTLSPRSPRRSTPGTKSPVMLSPGREHSMEVLIAMKRGKPQFLPPGEHAPEIDDEDAHMDERKKKAKPGTHDSGFRDEQDRLEKDKDRNKHKISDLDKYRPSNFYPDQDLQIPEYDIDDSPWDSHYQIGPDTYLMASRGANFNSRVRDYRRNLWGEGAPLVRQGILGVRNMDVTVRERRRYTDILREMQQQLEPKSANGSTRKTAVERIKDDVAKAIPATKKNADGTSAPIFASRLRDAYLVNGRDAVFECAVVSSPAAKIEWTFQEKALEQSDRVIIEQFGPTCRLTIRNPVVYDLGEYACTASNEYGTEKCSSRLVTGDTPARPGRPECELASDTELFMTWEVPEGPTYLEGITYRLEFRPCGMADVAAPWTIISDHVDDEAVVVKHLEPLGVYQFRVTARNGFGLGVPSLSSRMVQTHGRGATKLAIDILKTQIRLNVVNLPQKSAPQLNEISEESESEQAEIEQKSKEQRVELSTNAPEGRFQLDSLLFKTKKSVIRLAVDQETEGQAHCVAKISPSSAGKNEFELLRDGQHENVQRLVAANVYDDHLFLFTERLYEDVFVRFCRADYYNEEQVALTIRQLTSALHWLHFRGIVHLDVNPHNVMFQSKRNWIVKLVDFGSAQKASEARLPDDFDVQWAPPEFHADGVIPSGQADVWGMGIITFCLLGGFHPFTSEYDAKDEIKDNVMNVKCDPNLIPVNASQECLSFVTWALKKSPTRRMRTDEALSHRFLSTDSSMVRRRESVKLSASRLRKTAHLTRQDPEQPTDQKLDQKYGSGVIAQQS